MSKKKRMIKVVLAILIMIILFLCIKKPNWIAGSIVYKIEPKQSDYETKQICTCSSCQECTEKLNDPSCHIVQVTADFPAPSTCIDDPEISGKIFDCQGHSVYKGQESFMLIKDSENFTVKNCDLEYFQDGFRFEKCSNATIANITIKELENIVVKLVDSENTTIDNITFTAGTNPSYAIYSINSANTTVKNTAFTTSRFDIFISASARKYCTMNFENTYGTPTTTNSTPGIKIIDYSNAELNNILDDLTEIIICFAQNVSVKDIEISHSTTTNGILVINSSNVTFTDVKLNVNSVGIDLTDSKNVFIENSTISSIPANGAAISANRCENVLVKNISTQKTYFGTKIEYSENVTVNKINIVDSSYGITSYFSQGVRIANVSFSSSEYLDIDVKADNPMQCPVVENCNGSEGKKILYYKNLNSVLLSSMSPDELILCNTSNLTIRNVTIIRTVKKNNGIITSNSSGIRFENNRIQSAHVALFGYKLQNSTILNMSAIAPMYGIYLQKSTYNTITNSSFESVGTPIFFDESTENTIKNSYFINTGKEIHVSKNNFIYNNFFNQTPIIIESDINYWNTTKQPGKRIYSKGPLIGGNYWIPYSETCADADKDGFCDNPYRISMSEDYLPLSNKYRPVCYCINCSDCSQKLADPMCEEVVLNRSTALHAEKLPCIEMINLTNKTFRCTASIVGNGSSEGITLKNTTNIKVSQCVVSNFSRAVSIEDSFSVTLENISSNQTNNSIIILTTTSALLKNNTLVSSEIGILVNNSKGIRINKTDIDSGQIGINFCNVNNSYVIGTSISSETCINLTNAQENSFFNNLMNCTVHAIINPLLQNNWNTSKQFGTRIYSPGYMIGGNYWTNPSATGFSDNCTDADLDGFCDSAYQLAPNNTDHLPYSNAFTPGICECDSCSLCTNAMNDPSCAIVKLVSDIGGSVSTCIDNPLGFSNKTLDCDGHIIQATKHGICLTTNLENSVIKNCVLKDMKYGMEIISLNNFTFQNITIQSSALDEAIFGKVNNNLTFSNIKIIGASSSYGLGFFQARSTGLKLVNFTITRLKIGLQIEDNSERFLIDKLNVANLTYGIHIISLVNSIIRNSIFQSSVPCAIAMLSGGNNLIYNNLFNGTSISVSVPNYWNTSKQFGTRIYSPGYMIGGNYWTNPSATGFSDNCTDADLDGFCDGNYTINRGNIDFLPLSDEFQSNCIDLNNESTFKGRVVKSGNTLYVRTSVEICSGTYHLNDSPATIINSSNTVFSCQPGTILLGTGTENAIYSNFSNVTISNCSFESFKTAIILEKSGNILSNSFVQNALGLNLTDAGVLIEDNIFDRNSMHVLSVAGNNFTKNCWKDAQSLDIKDSDYDGFGDSGSAYPYCSSNGGLVSDYVYDYMPRMLGCYPYCGDGICQSNENYLTCPNDCPPVEEEEETTLRRRRGSTSLQKESEEKKECVPVWNCTQWSECINGTQRRFCKEIRCGLGNKTEYRPCVSEQIKPKQEKPLPPPFTESLKRFIATYITGALAVCIPSFVILGIALSLIVQSYLLKIKPAKKNANKITILWLLSIGALLFTFISCPRSVQLAYCLIVLSIFSTILMIIKHLKIHIKVNHIKVRKREFYEETKQIIKELRRKLKMKDKEIIKLKRKLNAYQTMLKKIAKKERTIEQLINRFLR